VRWYSAAWSRISRPPFALPRSSPCARHRRPDKRQVPPPWLPPDVTRGTRAARPAPGSAHPAGCGVARVPHAASDPDVWRWAGAMGTDDPRQHRSRCPLGKRAVAARAAPRRILSAGASAARWFLAASSVESGVAALAVVGACWHWAGTGGKTPALGTPATAARSLAAARTKPQSRPRLARRRLTRLTRAWWGNWKDAGDVLDNTQNDGQTARFTGQGGPACSWRGWPRQAGVRSRDH